MKVLITGGHGSIAQGILKALIQDSTLYHISTPSRSELDVSIEEDVSKYISGYRPDVLINCAGYIHADSLISGDTDKFIKHFTINTFAPYWCSKYASQVNKDVIIVNIGSTSGFEGRGMWGAYCASKAALISLTESLTKEGIRCYTLNPSRTATKMREELFPDEDKTSLMSPERVGEFVVKIIKGEFSNSSHIIVKKDHYYVLPSRECAK